MKSRLDVDIYPFSNRVISDWNALSEEIIDSSSLTVLNSNNGRPYNRSALLCCL